MRTRFGAVTLALVTVVALPLGAQSRGNDEAALADSLLSPNVAVRAEAFESLSKRGLITSRIASALHELLRRENAYVFGSYTSEGYSEYYAEVVGACMRYCDRLNPKVNQTLAGGWYNTTSELALELTRDHGPDILPRLFELTQSQGSIWSESRRQTGVVMLGLVAERSRRLSPGDRQRIRATALEALRDSTSLVVRRAGITTLGIVGNSTDVALLQRIANSDPDHRSFKGVTTYPTRERAAEAIRRINARGQK